MVAWPTPQEYNEAIQNPRSHFQDSELRSTVPELTPLGLPKPITGNFASVYEMRSGPRRIAVRCFFRECVDMRSRYAAIGSHVERVRLPYTVEFAYVEPGIRVRGSHFPVLKMEWVAGRLLDEYIRDHLSDSAAIAGLAAAWKVMAMALRRAAVAHGDLQHGNVMLVNGSIKLLDYDGMYVPALDGKQSLELGHPNYQHPGRTGSLFSLDLDNFSHWVIYTSLVAVAADPSLWAELGAGDERLLFGRGDFENPSTSPAFRSLQTRGSEESRALAVCLRSFLEVRPEAIPPLDAQAELADRPRRMFPRRPPKRWIDQRTRPRPGQGHLPEWVSEQVPASGQSLAFALSPRAGLLRLGIAVSLALTAFQLLPVSGAMMPAMTRLELVGAVLLVDLTALGIDFRRNPLLKQKQVILRQRRQQLRALRRLERPALRLERKRDSIRAHQSRSEADISRRKSRLGVDRERRRQAVRDSLVEAMNPLRARIQQLESAQAEEVRMALDTEQKRNVHSYLRSRRLRSAHIKGIGVATKARLWSGGVRTAADVNVERTRAITGIGPAKAAALLKWHGELVRGARHAMPSSLPESLAVRIRERHGKRRKRIQRRQEALLLEAARVQTAISEVYDLREAKLDERLVSLNETSQQRRMVFEAEIARLHMEQLRPHRRLEAIERELEAYAGVTLAHYLGQLVLGKWAESLNP